MLLRFLDKMLYQEFINISKKNIPFKNLNTTEFKNILSNYNSDDWKQYTQNNIEKYVKYKYSSPIIHNYYSIEILSWPPNTQSKIHSHAYNGCLMKILDGQLQEEQYDNNFNIVGKNTIIKNDITYIDDNIAFHKIINNSNNYSYSLHVYSPNYYVTRIFK